MKLQFQTDDGIGTRANLGVIVLETDETIEDEFRRMISGGGIALYASRIPMVPEVRPNAGQAGGGRVRDHQFRLVRGGPGPGRGTDYTGLDPRCD